MLDVNVSLINVENIISRLIFTVCTFSPQAKNSTSPSFKFNFCCTFPSIIFVITGDLLGIFVCINFTEGK